MALPRRAFACSRMRKRSSHHFTFVVIRKFSFTCSRLLRKFRMCEQVPNRKRALLHSELVGSTPRELGCLVGGQPARQKIQELFRRFEPDLRHAASLSGTH